MNASLTHHNLHAALIEDDNGPGVLLQQDDSCGETQSVVLHPYQLRHVCEQLGLLSADAGAAKRIETLERRLHVLHDRIDHLGHYLTHYSDHEHADLSFERDYAMATVSICFRPRRPSGRAAGAELAGRAADTEPDRESRREGHARRIGRDGEGPRLDHALQACERGVHWRRCVKKRRSRDWRPAAALRPKP